MAGAEGAVGGAGGAGDVLEVGLLVGGVEGEGGGRERNSYLDFVKNVVDVGSKGSTGGNAAAESETGPDTEDGDELHVFAPVEVLEEAESISVGIAPIAW